MTTILPDAGRRSEPEQELHGDGTLAVRAMFSKWLREKASV